ncbi:hypothetical protein EV196_11343 [Mariniflexile fucanivorans]|uniref:Uncharacterized protein n=1 Tax=Mariniflexile fucanivorans TaxID=264023 RepID=A0A4R1R9V0_9FLAO|nr:hypothetical protein [Mariniflexile fucanivorans]TCL62501.1 hypothetical protein EV196_11343 [Mariniflexile fucanivorans]
MKKYPSPKPFDPSAEDQKRVAEKLAKHFSPDKVLVTKAGEKVQGTKKST